MIRRLFSLVPLWHIYIGLRLLPDMSLSLPGLVVAILLLAASTVMIPLAMMSRSMARRPLADRIAWGGFLLMGLFSSMLVLTILRDIVLLAGAIGGWWLDRDIDTRGLRVISAVAVPLVALLASIAGFVNARRIAAVRRVDVALQGLPQALQGYTIAQLTDVHVGPTIKRGTVAGIVEAVNALDVDCVALTGDMVDGSVHDLASHMEPLSRLRARDGCYIVTGNHEYYSGVHAWLQAFRRLGLRVLQNEHVVLRREAAVLVLAGVTDFHGGYFDPAHESDPVAALAGAPPEAAVKILLAHQPRSAFAASRAGFDLQLSGHTHGGQFAPWMFLVRLQQPFTAGLHRLGALQVYVSRGTGYWGPPKRLGAPAEITCIRLVRASSSSM